MSTAPKARRRGLQVSERKQHRKRFKNLLPPPRKLNNTKKASPAKWRSVRHVLTNPQNHTTAFIGWVHHPSALAWCLATHLEGRLHQDVAQHRFADEGRDPLVRPPVQQRQGRGLRAEGEGAHRIHDEIYPEHHEGVERGVLPGEGADEHNQKSHDWSWWRGRVGERLEEGAEKDGIRKGGGGGGANVDVVSGFAEGSADEGRVEWFYRNVSPKACTTNNSISVPSLYPTLLKAACPTAWSSLANQHAGGRTMDAV